MKVPKFKIGDKVSHRKDLYGETQSIVKTLTRRFYNNDGGLAYLERDLPLGNPDYTTNIEGEGDEACLVISFKGVERERVRFSGYTYVVTNHKMNTIISEKGLKLDRQPESRGFIAADGCDVD